MDDRPGALEEWRRSWSLPFIGMLGFCLSLIHLYAIGSAIRPIEHELGWSRATITGGLTVVGTVTAVCAPIIGWLVDRYGPRWIALAGVLLHCVALSCLSLVGNSLVTWWCVWALIALTVVLVKPMVWSSEVVTRFDRSRGLALAIIFCGSGLGGTFIPPLMTYLIGVFGWRQAYLVMGLGWFLVLAPITFFFFQGSRGQKAQVAGVAPRPGMRTGVSARAALFSGLFIRLAICAMLFGGYLTALFVHMVPILEGDGLSAASAADLAGLMGIGAIVGRLAAGLLLDKVHASRIIVGTFLLPTVAVAILVAFPITSLSASCACVMLGLAFGSELDLLSYLASRYFGNAAYSTVFGAIIGLLSFSTGIGPLIAGFTFDRTGTYSALLFTSMPVFLLCILLIGRLGPYPDFTNREGSGDDAIGI